MGQRLEPARTAQPIRWLFGIDDDSHLVRTLALAAPAVFVYEGQWYIASLLPGLDGVQLSKLKWIAAP
jgi:hypothetical protein